jgi:hypothetical protein
MVIQYRLSRRLRAKCREFRVVELALSVGFAVVISEGQMSKFTVDWRFLLCKFEADARQLIEGKDKIRFLNKFSVFKATTRYDHGKRFVKNNIFMR